MSGWTWAAQKRQERATLVEQAIHDLTMEGAGPNGITVLDPGTVAQRAGVSVSQAREAVEDLREQTDRDDAIITLLGRGGGWVLTNREDLIRWFMKWRTQQALTIMRRTYYGAVRPFLKRVLSQSQPEVAQQIGGAFEDAIDRLTVAVARA